MHPAVGLSEIRHDLLDEQRAAALHATLAREGRPPKRDQPLPPFWHQIYFWNVQPPALLGRDGHPRLGTGLIPDLDLPQRMWAGGRLEILAPLIVGRNAEKKTTVEDIVSKTGRSGKLAFVALRHDVIQDGRLCVTERQDLVFKAYSPAGSRPAPSMAPIDEDESETVAFSTTLLFRYSALTFNGHRIHYDADYARSVEGYSNLVVHGPLLAQMLIALAERRLGDLTTFDFRATSPLMVDETASLCARGNEYWVRGPDGRLCMEAWAH